MNNGVFGELTWAASEQNKLISGARLDRHQVTNYTRAGEPTRSATLPLPLCVLSIIWLMHR